MKNNSEEQKTQASETRNRFSRREILNGLATIPVLGLFAFEFIRKQTLEKKKKSKILSELDLRNEAPAVIHTSTTRQSTQIIRLGIIGFGRRGESLARAAGFAHPEWIERAKKAVAEDKFDTRLQEWLNQEDLNVAITGVCDVFDLRAQRGITAAKNELRPGCGAGSQPRVKRFSSYQEMLASDEIDAVIIATPDHHHAQMTIDAVNAGKHVYCEKCMTRTLEEVYKVEEAVRNSNVVFQLGHQYSQNESFLKAKEIIDKNILGKITLVETTTNRNTPDGAWIRHIDKKGNLQPGSPDTIDWHQWLGSRPKVPFSLERYYNWATYFDYSTGIVGQLFSHEFDSVNQLLSIGIPKSVVASGGAYFYKDGRETPDVFHAVFEYPDRQLTVLYSASLANSRSRNRVFMGHDGSMELGQVLKVMVDQDSTRFKQNILNGIIDLSTPLFVYRPGSKGIDAVTSASEKYYASRGLIYTYKHGKRINITHLHLKEWLDCIRFGGRLSCGIDKGFEETITCQMATRSYLEKRRVEWDPVKKRIV